jgi:hypothetical protein
MNPAWIAVIGTLGGVVVTSASGIIVGWLTLRGQRHNTERQRTHEIDEHRRAERRETFVEYLAAYSELREKVLTLHQQSRPLDAPLAEIYPNEVARFSRAYQALRIFCAPPTGEAAHDCSSHLWDLADAVQRGDAGGVARDRDEGRRLRRTLRAAMQRELGLTSDETSEIRPRPERRRSTT